MEAVQQVYVVKVTTLPDPLLQFPSERKYSALTVAGIAFGHLVLGGLAALLGALALLRDPPNGDWAGHMGVGVWVSAAALQAAVSGLLAWRRWYQDRYIAWFYRSSIVAALVAAAGLLLTAAAMAYLHENVVGNLDSVSFNNPEPEDISSDEGPWESWRGSAHARSVIATNVLMACFLELLWSILGARIAWNGVHAVDLPDDDRSTPKSSDLERGAADGNVDNEYSEVKTHKISENLSKKKNALSNNLKTKSLKREPRLAPRPPEYSSEEKPIT